MNAQRPFKTLFIKFVPNVGYILKRGTLKPEKNCALLFGGISRSDVWNNPEGGGKS